MSSNHMWPALDTFQEDLASSGARAAIARLAGSLARQRAALSRDDWKTSCAAVGRHPAVVTLLEDPYSRDARTKPAGYAGDARTLDYVYLQNPGAQPVSEAGRSIFEVSTTVPIAAAVRERSAALAAAIAQRTSGGPISVASIACGHARELDRLGPALRSRIRFWGLDQDAASVASCRARNDPRTGTFAVGSVRELIAGRVRIPPSDVIYASGLFDYLDDRAGSVLVKRMFASLNEGGILLVPNLTPHNDEAGYMEAVMDWWMCYRTERDMWTLTRAVDKARAKFSTFVTSDGRIAWLRIERTS
jgi:extracellular factor (EF) 3-hydroxypalmitic acid methyl ester biosynthesis protein